jgi:amino acid adenylation domain-containing protein
MPIGSVGELVVEGYTVARGYLNDEAKTAKAFIENPDWTIDRPGLDSGAFVTTRMYKTGDLVRFNSNGSVSYIGRKDTQIKLNGQRIELGEIESHVKSKFPEGIQSVVELVVPASRNSSKALAIFFSHDDQQGTSSPDSIQPASAELPAADELLLQMDERLRDMCKTLENDLAGVLPSYMIPSIFVPITKMPWTSAGKLDRNRLRNIVHNLTREAMAPYRLSSAINKRKPTTLAEQKLQKIVCAVLNLPTSAVGVDDSFIVSDQDLRAQQVTNILQRLGGDSVAAMRLVAAAQAEHMQLSVMDIFKQPKLADLAAKCGSSTAEVKLEKAIEPFQLLSKPVSGSHILNELASQCQVTKDKIQDAYPASPLQEAFVTLSIKQPGAYIAQHVLSLSDAVDLRRFKASWEKAVQEMDILRTRIAQTQSGAFVQVVLAEDPIQWRETITLKEAEKEAMRIPSHIGGQLAAYTMVHTAQDERYLVWTLGHALYDGWSIPSMLQRVEQIYQVGSSSMPKTPYTKFIKYLQDTSPETSTKFWRESLAGTTPYQFPQQAHLAGETEPNGRVLQHIAKLPPNRHSDVTVSNVIRAAWALLLAAYTDNDDVVFGETLTGRDIAVSGIADICGPTLTTVPTRVKLSQDMKILDLLQSISQNAVDRVPHQHFGLSEIKRIDQDAAAACDFQNLLIIQTGRDQPAESMWTFHDNEIQTNYFTYPLVLECNVDKTSVEIVAHYHEHVLSTWQVQRIVHQLESILNQLSSVNALREVHVFSEQDMQFVRSWNANEEVVVDETMHALFLKQASAKPHSQAVSAWDGDFTYAELRDVSSRLAQELIRLGAGPEKMVPFCFDKSRWAVAAMLGTMMAGAAFVPLSPEHPPERHRQLIQDCRASLLLCPPAYAARFVDMVSKVVTVGDASISQFPPLSGPVPALAKSSNVAYVLYTSGSTGVPKGVVIEHRAIASSSAAMCRALHLEPTSRVFQFSSFVFDVSVLDILTTLTIGAAVCIPSEDDRTADLAGAINKLKATWVSLTASAANTMDGPHVVPTLKTLASAGEALTPETINKWGSGLQLLNAYGPTEGSVIAVANDQVSTQRDPTNIGYMLATGKAWITKPGDPNILAPVGAVGELCFSGSLLAREYLNNRTKTAEAFVESPTFMKAFAFIDKYTRMYRTGDLVSYGSSGSIHYVGRKDNQVKLAGQRMELGEIEHHLQADERIREAVVLMPKSGPGKRKLIAAISLRSAPADPVIDKQSWNIPLGGADVLRQVEQVKSRLSDILPPYMNPTVWVAIKSVPRTASAKLDKKQVSAWLENMDDENFRKILELEGSTEPAEPATETTRVLQGVWAQVLNVPVADVRLNKSWLCEYLFAPYICSR